MSKNVSSETLAAKRAEAKLGGGQARIDAQHQKKKLTARERLELLFDDGSFEELGALVTHRSSLFGLDKQQFLGDGVITGYGKVKICGPLGVMAMVCSQCEAQDLSAVATDQSSSKTTVCAEPKVIIGSSAKTLPTDNFGPLPPGP